MWSAVGKAQRDTAFESNNIRYAEFNAAASQSMLWFVKSMRSQLPNKSGVALRFAAAT